MTPAEKIIVRFYAANTFMYNNSNDIMGKNKVYKDIQKALDIEANLNYTVQEICEKWQNLCNSFVRAIKKIENKEPLTYLENSLYQRLFFLRSFITNSSETINIKKKKNEEAGKLLQKFKCEKKVKVNVSASEEMLNQVDEILNKENAVCSESAAILNSIILSHTDTKVQRLCLNFILKSIKTFVMTCNKK